jgi:hypothetical protein
LCSRGIDYKRKQEDKAERDCQEEERKKKKKKKKKKKEKEKKDEREREKGKKNSAAGAAGDIYGAAQFSGFLHGIPHLERVRDCRGLNNARGFARGFEPTEPTEPTEPAARSQ